MGCKLFVGNLPYEITDADLVEVFTRAGTVTSAKVVMDRFTGRSKGFGFVEMETDESAQSAVGQFNGCQLNERTITVAVARPEVPRAPMGAERGGRH